MCNDCNCWSDLGWPFKALLYLHRSLLLSFRDDMEPVRQLKRTKSLKVCFSQA